MRGVGGPILCIGDLISDVGEGDDVDHHTFSASSPLPSSSPSTSSVFLNSDLTLHSSHLPKLFQENYDQLKEALAGTDHSWTTLTLKLCTSLETANKLIQTTNSEVGLLSKKIGDLEKIIKKGDSSVAAARAVHRSLDQK